jgi:predicted RNA-binding protein with PIN domain
MSEPTLYLFDGYNLLHAGPFEDARALTDALASFVALHGARGVVVFDGVGRDATLGSLEIRYAPHADTLLERLAAENRDREQVCLVSSDVAVRGTSGQAVKKLSSIGFLRELESPQHTEEGPQGLAGRLDEGTRAQLELLRRGEGSAPAPPRPPVSAADLQALEEGLGLTLPDELRELLQRTDGMGTDVVWPARRMLEENRYLRTDPELRDLYMPFDHLLFIGGEGNGDLIGYRVLQGEVDTIWLYEWDHETDSRTAAFPSLETYLRSAGA